MRVEAYNQVQQIYGKTKPGKVQKTAKVGSADKLQLSSMGKDFQLAKQAVAAAPDVREEVVAPLKAGIQSGTYRVENGRLADKLVQMSEEMRQSEWQV